MDEAEQEPQVAAQLAQIRAQESRIQPEEIRLLDPCMGSGHILVYAFDVLMEIYRTQGYTDRDAVSAIVENNLYGLDIDDRAAQLAYFALMMKACEHDRRFLRRGIQPHVCAITEWSGSQTDEPAWSDAERRAAHMLRETFKDAKEFGSILSIPKPLADALNELGENPFAGEATLGVDTENLRKLAAQAKIMARKYDVVVTNPPYMGSSGMGAKLAEFVKKQYPDSKSDLFAVFMEKVREYAKQGGKIGLVTMNSWMFLTSFETLRKCIIEQDSIETINHLGMEAFEGIIGKVVQTVAFTFLNKIRIENYKGNAVRLTDFYDSQRWLKEKEFFNEKNHYIYKQDNFEKIPGAPVAYWVSEKVGDIFINTTALGKTGQTTKGLITGDNNRFMRLWWEIQRFDIRFDVRNNDEAKASGAKWFPCNKGGDYRKWYGNQEYIINWKDDGKEILKDAEKDKRHSQDYYTRLKFKPSISWSSISSNKPSFRYRNNELIDHAGMAFVPDEEEKIYYDLGFMNSIVSEKMLQILSPTINYNAGEIGSLPIDFNDNNESNDRTKIAISISKEDWDSFETSWDFKKHPMI